MTDHDTEVITLAVRSDPTVRRRRLGRELRRYREAAQKTALQVAAELGCSDAKISYIEAGRYKVQWRDVRDMLIFYEVNDPAVVESLTEMAKQSGQKSWWQSYRDTMKEGLGTYVGLEGEAQTVQRFELHVVPGILQTERYARALTQSGARVRPEDVEKVVALRMERQERLTDSDPLELRVIMDEEVLRRPIGGPSVLKEQLEHLLKLDEQPHILIQVLPTEVGAHPGLEGTFTILEFGAGDPAVVYIEHKEGCLYLEEPDEVAAYTMTLDSLRSDSLSRIQSADLIRRTVAELP